MCFCRYALKNTLVARHTASKIQFLPSPCLLGSSTGISTLVGFWDLYFGGCLDIYFGRFWNLYFGRALGLYFGCFCISTFGPFLGLYFGHQLPHKRRHKHKPFPKNPPHPSQTPPQPVSLQAHVAEPHRAPPPQPIWNAQTIKMPLIWN